MLDRRFPQFQRITEASALSDAERLRAQKIAEEVGRRTQTSCAWNAQTHSLHFYYGSVDVSAFAFPFLVGRDGVAPVRQGDVEDMVALIRLGQLPPDEKDYIAAQNKVKEEYEALTQRQRFEDEIRPDAQDYADFLSRKRRGTQRVSA